jgi:hypothetical protein
MPKVKIQAKAKSDSGSDPKPSPKKKSEIVIGFTSDPTSATRKVLLAGNSGVGKTRLAGQWPDPIIINLEQKLEVLKKLKIPFVDVSQEEDAYASTLAILRALRDKDDPFSKLKPYPKTVVLDSITRLSTKIEHNIVLGHKEYGKETQEEGLYLSDYNIVGRRIFVILDLLVETGLDVVVTCGITPTQDKGGDVYLDPNLTGKKLGPQIAHFFTEVYYMDKFVGDGKPRFMLYSTHAAFRHARTSCDVPMEIEDPSHKALEKFYRS